MTYCKDCRTEFMVEADDPCPRCGRYLGGARMGQRAEVALPEQSAQPAAQKTLMDAVREHFGFAQPEPPVAQQAPVPPPAAPAPIDEPPRPAQQEQTLWDAIAQGVFSLFVRLVPLILLAKMLVDIKLLPSAWAWPMVVGLAITMAVITILSKTSQRAAEERARAAAQQPPAAPAPIDEPPRPAQQVQTTLDAVADGRASLFMRLVWAIPVLIGWGLLGLMVFAGSGESIWIWVKWMVMGVLLGSVYVWFEKMHQRVAQTWRPAGESTVPASSPAPAPAPKAALEGEPNRLAEEERTTVDVVANGCASLFARLVLLVVLAVPALIGFAGLVLIGEHKPSYVYWMMWFLYLSVFAPPFCCLLTPYDELSALLREHPWFWQVWLWWVMPAVALFLLLGG